MSFQRALGAACGIAVSACVLTHDAPAVASVQPDAGSLRAQAVRLEAEATRAASAAGEHSVESLPVLPPGAGGPGASLDGWLRAQLRSIRHEPRKAQARDLRVLAGSVRRLAFGGAGQAPAQSPKEVAAHVLSSKDYRESGSGQTASPRETFWEKVERFVGRLLSRIFEGIFSATSSAPIVGQIVAVALVALLALVIVYLAIRVVAALARRRPGVEMDEGSPLPSRVDPDLLYRSGVEAAERGSYAQAIALVFQASLAWFDRHGALALDPSLTPGEYRRAVRLSVSKAAPSFDRITQAFVLAAFAELPASKSDWSEADSAFAALRSAVPA